MKSNTNSDDEERREHLNTLEREYEGAINEMVVRITGARPPFSDAPKVAHAIVDGMVEINERMCKRHNELFRATTTRWSKGYVATLFAQLGRTFTLLSERVEPGRENGKLSTAEVLKQLGHLLNEEKGDITIIKVDHDEHDSQHQN